MGTLRVHQSRSPMRASGTGERAHWCHGLGRSSKDKGQACSPGTVVIEPPSPMCVVPLFRLSQDALRPDKSSTTHFGLPAVSGENPSVHSFSTEGSAGMCTCSEPRPHKGAIAHLLSPSTDLHATCHSCICACTASLPTSPLQSSRAVHRPNCRAVIVATRATCPSTLTYS